MNKGLSIEGEEIYFKKWAVGEIWYPCITKSFNIRFEDIRIVSISPRLALDDEMLIVSIIDKDKKFHQFSNWEFGKEPIKKFEEKLGLNSIRLVEWGKFTFEEHENHITDKIIYPKELYWRDLFIKPKNPKKALIQIMKFLAIKKSISGKIQEDILEYLKQ